MASRAGVPPGDAREDWAIIRALSDVVGKRLPFDTLGALRRHLYGEYPHMAALDAIVPGDLAASLKALADAGKKASPVSRHAFSSPVRDFYFTNPIARASAVMAECSVVLRNVAPQAAE